MQIYDVIKEKRSIREYKEKPLEKDIIDNLMEYSHQVEPLIADISTNSYFVEEGHSAHDLILGNAGYHGMAIDAPHYVILLSEKKPHYLKNAAYMMEQVLIKAYEMKLGSCWIDVMDRMNAIKEKLGIDQQGEIVAMAALGYPKTNAFGLETTVADRKSVEEMVYKREWEQVMELEEIRQRGLEHILYHARFAPSWGNTQPWKFILDEDKLILTILNQDQYALEGSKDKSHELDSGIMMLYLEKIMHEQGIASYWNLDIEGIDKEKYKIPDKYRIVGYFPI